MTSVSIHAHSCVYNEHRLTALVNHYHGNVIANTPTRSQAVKVRHAHVKKMSVLIVFFAS